MYSAQGIFQHHFQYKKVHTILDKIWYLHFDSPEAKKMGDDLKVVWAEFSTLSQAVLL
jgi:hypothetical protein